MRAVVQRVSSASVTVEDQVVGCIGHGLCVFVGALAGDDASDVEFMARKLATLRVFHDAAGKMNRNVIDVGGELLIVSQFTLAADTTSGTRPSFTAALEPAEAEGLLEKLVAALQGQGIKVGVGRFGARMRVEIVNEGPVTIQLDSRARKKR
ncbi:D-tyrosyl-tRNA(Tyr) deacylase [bacterium]|nr:D-tyrosyl-tRNA(Tyr) deacylase [bacterium]